MVRDAARADVREHGSAATVPFAMHRTHLMMARGGLNGAAGLTFLVDSGLASEAAFAAPPQTLDLLGIAHPETFVDERAVGGGGGEFATGEFPIDRLALGSLEQNELVGLLGPLTEQSHRAYGFIQDGLISHQFLRRYASWTIDFDSMEMLFELPR